jgi:hypothetical protein
MMRFVIGTQGRLIAHPDISLVLRNIDLSHLAQVQAARAGEPSSREIREATGVEGRSAPGLCAGRATRLFELLVDEPYARSRLVLVRAGRSICPGQKSPPPRRQPLDVKSNGSACFILAGTTQLLLVGMIVSVLAASAAFARSSPTPLRRWTRLPN